MRDLTRQAISQPARLSSRVRLPFALVAAVGVFGLAAVSFAPAATTDWKQFVGYIDGTGTMCSQLVWPGSDQIDDGWNNTSEVDAWTYESECSALTVQGALRVYLRRTNGTNACSSSGFGYVVCIVPSAPYVRAHCVNTSGSSIRWMQCWKYNGSQGRQSHLMTRMGS
jgi:hypothetical protein